MAKRVWKLQDFVAHAGKAQCARLGEKSGQVLATGGEDKKVNIWKVGKPNALMSLQGHTSSVDCLVFDKQEEVLVVGCSGGSMQVWNLEYRKMAGTLSGHRTACGAVEFHPYGEFFASGSADTNLKIWDLRRKSCIQTYKGHTGSINAIRFSPHGRWVATGGQDNQVKIWDLTAGKLMRDLEVHKGPIRSIAFHPKEYLLATGSADRTAKLWSLETFQAVSSTELGSSPVEAVKFWVEEQSIIAASQDALRVYPVDNLTVASDTCEVDWRGLQDMRLCASEEKLISVSTEGTQLGIWVADLQKKDSSIKGAAGYGRLHGRAGAGGYAGGCAVNGAAGGPARQPTAQAYQQPIRRVHSNRLASDYEEDDAAGGGDTPQAASAADMTVAPAAVAAAAEDATKSSGAYPVSLAVVGVAGSGDGFESAGGVGTPKATRGGPPEFADQTRSPNAGGGLAEHLADFADPPSGLRGGPPARQPRGQRSRTPSAEMMPPAAFGGGGGGAASRPVSGGDVPRLADRRPATTEHGLTLAQMNALAAQHSQMLSILQRRAERVRRLKDLWARGNVNRIGAELNMPQDHAVFCDFARAVMRQNLDAALNLDACLALLPILRDLLSSKYDDFVITALQFIEVLLQNFSKLITDTRQSCAGIPERQLDLPREERLRKCNACHDHFREVLRLLPEAQIGSRFSGFKASLQHFLQTC